MTSNININNIDGTFPISGISNDSQGFRNNFTNIKNNIGYAKREIEDLQNKSVVKSALSGTVIDNSMNGAPFNGAEVFDLRETEHNIGIASGTVVLDHSIAHYHSFRTNGSISLSFTNVPESGKVGRFRLKVTVTNTYHKITLPENVTQGVDGIVNFDDFDKSVSFDAIGTYVFEFITVDNGANYHIQDLTRGSKISSAPYELPPASGSILGGIKIGGTLTMSGSNVLNYNLPVATNVSLGGVKVSNLNGVALDENNVLKVVTASDTQIGGVKVGNGLSINGTTGTLSVTIPTFFNFATGNASPVPDSPILLGTDNTPDATLGKVSGFNAYDSTDFPNKYYTGFTVVGAGVGAQIGMGWDIGAPGAPGGSAGVAGTGAPTKMYFRVNDDNAPDGNGWSPWSRLITEHDNLGGGGGGGAVTTVSSDGLSFPRDPGGGTGDWAWIKYFSYTGEQTNLEIGVSNDSIGTAQDSINLVSPGGVGINKQTPRRMLDVNGTGIFTQTNGTGTTGAVTLAASDGDSTGPILQFVNNAVTSELAYIQADSTSKLIFKYGSGGLDVNDHLVISGSGLVGIGTQTSSRLAVAGIIESTTGGFKFPDGTVQTSANSGGVGSYSLPYASTERLGGIKVGGGLSIDTDGFLTVTGGGSGGSVNVIGAAESQLFTTVGTNTWTAPGGVTKVKAYVIGGGGGGGYTANDGEGGETITYGGLGGVAIGVYTVVPGTTYNVIVGAGGDGITGTSYSPGPNQFGNTGGSSSFGSFCSATGGAGGGGWLTSNTLRNGTSGTGTGGTLRNGAMSSGLSGIFVGTTMQPGNPGTTPTVWTVSSSFIPGTPGYSRYANTTSQTNAQGGVSGAVYLEWTGTSGGSGGGSFSGSYNDLTNKPVLFSGNYSDLIGKPTIPSAYTLPVATSYVLGGVKAGSGITINTEGVISSTSTAPWVGDTNGSWVGMYISTLAQVAAGQPGTIVSGGVLSDSYTGSQAGTWKIIFNSPFGDYIVNSFVRIA